MKTDFTRCLRHSWLKLVVALIAVVACNLPAQGQASSTSSLSGSVTDPTGDVIVGATVVVKNIATTAEFRTTTAGNGTFSVPALDAGAYVVTISAPGFKQAVIKDVKLDVGTPASVRISLEVGSANESVTVESGAR